VSLINDALKAAQRERSGRQSGTTSQQLEGFFPYAAGATTRVRSSRRPVIVVGGAAVVLLAITAWLMWPQGTKPPASGRPPIILPAPVTVSQTPPVVDSAAVATARPDAGVVTADRSPAATPDQQRSPGRSQQSASSSETRESATSGAAAATIPDPAPRRDSAGEQPMRAIVPKIDYEAQATVLFNAGELAAARDKFELATRFAPNARAWTNFGVTLQRLADYSGAMAAYRSAIGIDANYLEAWLYQGRLAAEQGDTARAIPLFQRARAINPRHAEVNVELARLEYGMGNWTEAKRFAEEAIRGDVTNTRAYWYLAVASDPLKDNDASIRGYSGYLQYVGDAPDQATFIGWARTRLAELRGKP
jgi:Flp pilus assembly protein TadD